MRFTFGPVFRCRSFNSCIVSFNELDRDTIIALLMSLGKCPATSDINSRGPIRGLYKDILGRITDDYRGTQSVNELSSREVVRIVKE